jgi:hypothetical protein
MVGAEGDVKLGVHSLGQPGQQRPFHCSVILIYDSLAESAIGRFVDWKAVTGVRASMADLPDWARAYRNFAAAFFVLRERINAETSIPATVKEIDHLLWQAGASR